MVRLQKSMLTFSQASFSNGITVNVMLTRAQIDTVTFHLRLYRVHH